MGKTEQMAIIRDFMTRVGKLAVKKGVKWYKYGLFWRRGDGDDDYTAQDRGDGVVDLIFNTLSKIHYEQDCSDWAHQSFYFMSLLLRTGIRYTEEFVSEYEVKVWWMYYIRRLYRKPLGKLGVKFKKPMYRKFDDITRDPFKAYYAVYAMLYKQATRCDRETLTVAFESVTIPLRIRRGSIVKLRRRLIDDDRPYYVKRLTYLEACAYKDWYEANYEDRIRLFYEDST